MAIPLKKLKRAIPSVAVIGASLVLLSLPFAASAKVDLSAVYWVAWAAAPIVKIRIKTCRKTFGLDKYPSVNFCFMECPKTLS